MMVQQGTATALTTATGVTTMQLGGVDIGANKVPLIHQVDIQVWADAPIVFGHISCIGSVKRESGGENLYSDADVLASVFINSYSTATAGFKLSEQKSILYPAPLAVALTELFIVCQPVGVTGYVYVRVFYEIKKVSASALVSLIV